MSTVIVDGVEKTFEQTFRDMWREIATHMGMDKTDYFIVHRVNITPMHLCFACEQCDNECCICPIVKWRKQCGTYIVPCIRRLFGQWDSYKDAGEYKKACKVAWRISELEWEEQSKAGSDDWDDIEEQLND